MGFQEKNAWICGVSTILIFGPYFCFVFLQPMSHIAFFAVAVVCLILLLTTFHTVNAIKTRSIRTSGEVPRTDELDQLIELRAAKWAGIVLATLVLVWSIAAMFGIPILGVSHLVAQRQAGLVDSSDFAIRVLDAMPWVHLLFAGFVVSNLVYYAKIVFAYRSFSNG